MVRDHRPGDNHAVTWRACLPRTLRPSGRLSGGCSNRAQSIRIDSDEDAGLQIPELGEEGRDSDGEAFVTVGNHFKVDRVLLHGFRNGNTMLW